MKKYIYGFIVIIVLVLAFGVYKIQKMPKTNTQSFSQEEADQSLTSFNTLNKAKVLEVADQNEEQNKHYSNI